MDRIRCRTQVRVTVSVRATVRVKVRVGIGCDVMTYLAPVFLLCLFRRSFFPSSPVPFSLSSWHFLMLPSKGVLLP